MIYLSQVFQAGSYDNFGTPCSNNAESKAIDREGFDVYEAHSNQGN
jgi:hypothetical protein